MMNANERSASLNSRTWHQGFSSGIKRFELANQALHAAVIDNQDRISARHVPPALETDAPTTSIP